MAAYMKIDGPGIPGQSTDSNHQDWIEIKSVNQNLLRPLAAGAGAAGQSSVQFRDIIVTTIFGKHVPELAKAVASGTEFDTVEIHVCTDQGGGKREPYYKLKLEKVHVTDLTVDNDTDGGLNDVVNVSLHYGKIEWAYTQWDGKENKGDTTSTWNRIENTE